MAALRFDISFLLFFAFCAVLSRPVSPLSSTHFKAEVIKTTWRESDAVKVGKLSKLRCAHRCAMTKCFAYHLAANGDCYFVRENKNWMEQRPVQAMKFWIKQGSPGTKCKSPAFPEVLGRSRYFLEASNKKNWSDAAAFCETRGGRLAQISSEAERQFVWSLINSPIPNTGRVNVGGYKVRGDGLPHSQGWKWRGSEEPIMSSLWQDSQPNNWKGEQYRINFHQNQQGIQDGGAHEVIKFLCECTTLL